MITAVTSAVTALSNPEDSSATTTNEEANEAIKGLWELILKSVMGGEEKFSNAIRSTFAQIKAEGSTASTKKVKLERATEFYVIRDKRKLWGMFKQVDFRSGGDLRN